jgi:Capsule polysaccharide biosynthesis protein
MKMPAQQRPSNDGWVAKDHHWWLAKSRKSLQAIEQWLSAMPAASQPRKGIVAVVCFRNRLWVEWAIYTACHLHRMGYAPVLLYSAREMGFIYGDDHPSGARPAEAGEVWSRVLRTPQFRTLDLDRYLPTGAVAEDWRAEAERFAGLGLSHDLRSEGAGAMSNEAYASALEAAKGFLSGFMVGCRQALEELRPDRAICPNGLIGWSGAFGEAARRVGIPTAFVERWTIRRGHMIYNIDRPAHDHDVLGWRQAVGPWGPDKDEAIQRLIRFQEGLADQRDPWLENMHAAQRSSTSAVLPAALQQFLRRPGRRFLLGTNVVGDNAVLDRATIFPSQSDWLAATCQLFRSHPDLNLVIRAHPDELSRVVRQRLGEVARSAARGCPNIFVIDGQEKVNTYALIAQMDAGIVWTSNLGVDLVVRGKPVVVAARAPYLQIQIGQAASSLQQYLDAVLELANNPVAPSAQAILGAKTYLWIVFHELSLDATGGQDLPDDYRLPPPGTLPQQELFYRILVGEVDAKCRTPPAAAV